MATVSAFPDALFNSGPTINFQFDQVPDYEVIRYVREDGGMAVNVRPCGPVRMTLVYEGLTEAEADTLDNHYALAKGKVNTFPFFDIRNGATHTGCSYEQYEAPKHRRYMTLSRRIVLVREA